MHSARILVLLSLFVKHVHLFSWDIVVATRTQLDFYYNDGTRTHTQDIPSARQITSVTYDPVHYRVLFTDRHDSTVFISSLDVSTQTVQRLVTTTTNYYVRLVYDPVTEALYWKDYSSIRTFSLSPASSNQAEGNVLVSLGHFSSDLAVDCCGGYIYWITDYEIERARLDGSEREVLIDNKVYDRRSLAIDQLTQKMYWTEQTHGSDDHVSIESANFNGKNRTTLYIVRNTGYAFSLAVSKDFIYWQNYNEQGIWRLPKYSTQTVATKLTSMSSSGCEYCHCIAANYTIKEQIQGINSCDALQGLIPNDSKSESPAPVCQNYCIQGECSVSAEGQPTCSCKPGYAGHRCEVNACTNWCSNNGLCSLNEKGEPACECTAGYNGERCDVSICKDYCSHGNCSVGTEGQPKCSCITGYSGERCEVSICKDYCFQGNCSVSTEGEPKCSCMPGYSGERCEDYACHKHCLNGGVCTLNEEDKPACQCTAGYDGGRCELPVYQDNSSVAGNSGKGTVSACHQFCLNHGACSLNEAREPVCQCTADYEGERCELSVNKDSCCPTVTKVTVTLSQGVQWTCASTVV